MNGMNVMRAGAILGVLMLHMSVGQAITHSEMSVAPAQLALSDELRMLEDVPNTQEQELAQRIENLDRRLVKLEGFVPSVRQFAQQATQVFKRHAAAIKANTDAVHADRHDARAEGNSVSVVINGQPAGSFTDNVLQHPAVQLAATLLPVGISLYDLVTSMQQAATVSYLLEKVVYLEQCIASLQAVSAGAAVGGAAVVAPPSLPLMAMLKGAFFLVVLYKSGALGYLGSMGTTAALPTLVKK